LALARSVIVAVVAWTASNSEGYAAPAALAADAVVLTVRDGALRVLTLARGDGSRALPGGFVGASETPEQTARRKLYLKTGLDDLYLEQLATFADPGRDPRGWIPTIAYLALVPPPATEAAEGEWTPVRDHPPLAFDHDEILRSALDRLEGKLWWSNVAVGILPGAFTMTDARRVYEAIAGRAYDAATFARDLKATGLVEATGERRSEGAGRPAALYRFAEREPRWGAGRRKRVGP
jgi:8-oxo-dGTP diphosphatase